jgi:GH35 family endo-1,4-beta-xylanase
MLFALAGLASTANAGPGLADGAAKFVGNIIQSTQVRGDYTELWNQATAENGCKWESIEGSRGNYNWGACDAAYNWAKENGGFFKFHALVWGGQYPSWLNGLSADETKKAITAWFDAVQKHYPDLQIIDVVNEAIRTGNGSYHSGYNKGNNIVPALGGDNNGDYAFVTTAFKMARERWPKAILIYNDYNTIQYDVDKGIDLVNTIKKNGAPIDAFGLQAHDLVTQGGGAGGTGGGGNCMDYNQFTSTMEKIHNQTQLPLFISEYDIPTTNDDIQEQCFKEQITYWMEAEYVAGITLWGYVYGQTWLDCDGVKGCSGIIKDGNDRKAMTWLKSYLSSHKGVNTTGLATGITTPPEPQKPFRGVAFDILADRIEAEDFDVPGVGRNEDGTSNNSYYDSDSDNNGGSSYREGTGVDIKDNIGSNQHAIGWNATGDWLEYTINVPEAGDYTLYAAVSGEGGQLQFSLDGTDIGDLLTVSKSNAEPSDEEVDESVYGDFFKVKTNVTLPSGQHILRMTVVQQWFDIDFFNFVKGKDAEDNAPVGTEAIAGNIHMSTPHLVEYDLIDIHGARLGHFSAYSLNEAIVNARNSKAVKSMGIYYLRSRATGKIHSFRVVK